MSGTVTAPGNQLHLKLFILCYKNVFYLQNQHIHTLYTQQHKHVGGIETVLLYMLHVQMFVM
jgi:hypothetical protein